MVVRDEPISKFIKGFRWLYYWTDISKKSVYGKEHFYHHIISYFISIYSIV